MRVYATAEILSLLVLIFNRGLKNKYVCFPGRTLASVNIHNACMQNVRLTMISWEGLCASFHVVFLQKIPHLPTTWEIIH